MPQPTQIVSTPATLHNAPATRYAWMLGDVELDYLVLDNRWPLIAVMTKITEMFVNAALEAAGEKPDTDDEACRGAKRYLLRPGWVSDLPGEYRLLTVGLIKTHLGHSRCSCNRYEGALGLPPRQWGTDVELTPDEQAACDDYFAAYDEHLDNFHAWRNADGSWGFASASDDHQPCAQEPGVQVDEVPSPRPAVSVDTERLERAVRAAHVGRRSALRQFHVMQALALGSGTAAGLCRRFGLDPDEVVGDERGDDDSTGEE